MTERNESELLTNPAVSEWLRRAIVETRGRDVLDALHDVEVLKKVLEQRWRKTLESAHGIMVRSGIRHD